MTTLLAACLSLTLILCLQQVLAIDNITISVGGFIAELPGADLLKGSGPKISISLTSAQITGPNLTFRTPVYKDDLSDSVYLFGPTLRVKAGGGMSIKLSNKLVQRGEAPSTLHNGFHNPAYTNLHTHGLHDDAGNLNQYATPTYTGGDNVFVTIPARPDSSSAPQSLTYDRTLPEDHLPGIYWYHPHAHGSTAIQTYSANGLIIVEDDPRWLPEDAGCGPMWNMLTSSEDVLLHLSLLTFKTPPGLTPLTQSASQNAEILSNRPTVTQYSIDANVQALSALSEPQNLLCCDDAAVASGEGALLTGSNADSDLMLVNGAWQPVIPVTSGVAQRWRLANTGYKRFADLQIVDEDTKQLTSACELQLVAKDGLYLMQIPRKVDHIFLAPGNRAELLVQCAGAIGKRFIITAGNSLIEPPFNNPAAEGGGGGGGGGRGRGGGGGAGAMNNLAHNQAVVAYIQITKGSFSKASVKDLPPKGCTPRYPTYAPDLRDEVLAASNVTENMIYRGPTTFTMAPGTGAGCYVDGKPFAYPEPDPIQLPLGYVVHWNFGRLSQHPMHVHTNPYQIVSLPNPTSKPYTSWFEEGDRHDTVLIPVLSMMQTVGIRLQPGPFPGFDLLHCHLLQHEDSGCMKVTSMYCPGSSPTDTQPPQCDDVQYPVKGTMTDSRFERGDLASPANEGKADVRGGWLALVVIAAGGALTAGTCAI